MDNKADKLPIEANAKKEKKQNKGSNIGADATLLTFSKIATSAIAMVMAMMLSRFRTKGEYATYNQILMVANLVSSFIMLGLPKSLNFFLAKTDSKEEKQKFLSFYYTLNTILSFVVGLVLVLSVNLIEVALNNGQLSSYLYFLALFPWTKIICSSIENLLIVYKKAKWLVAFRILNSGALLLSVIVVEALGWTFSHYMFIYVIVESVFAFSVYLIAGKMANGIYPYISGKMLKTVLAFSIPLGLASVVGTLNIELDKLIIGTLMTKEDFATYTNAARELPVTLISSSFTAVLLPQMVRMLSKDDTKKALKLWGNATTLSLMIISIISVGCFTFSEDVVKILYGEQYVAGKWVFGLYSLYLVLRCTYYGMVLNSVGKTNFIFWSSIGTLTSNAVLNVVFFFALKPFGSEVQMVSPALATLISTIAMGMIQLAVTAKYLKVKFREIFPWFEALKILLFNSAFGVVFYMIKQLIPLQNYLTFIKIDGFDGQALESVLLGLVWAVVYFAIMLKPIKRKWNSLKVKNND